MYTTAITEHKGYGSNPITGGRAIEQTHTSVLEGGWDIRSVLPANIDLNDLFNRLGDYDAANDGPGFPNFQTMEEVLFQLGQRILNSPNFPPKLKHIIYQYSRKLYSVDASTRRTIPVLLAALLITDQKRLELGSIPSADPMREDERADIKRKIRNIEYILAGGDKENKPHYIAIKKIMHNPANYPIEAPLNRKLIEIRRHTLNSVEPWTNGLYNILPRVHRNDPTNKQPRPYMGPIPVNLTNSGDDGGNDDDDDDENMPTPGQAGTMLLGGVPHSPMSPGTPRTPRRTRPRPAAAAAAAAAASDDDDDVMDDLYWHTGGPP